MAAPTTRRPTGGFVAQPSPIGPRPASAPAKVVGSSVRAPKPAAAKPQTAAQKYGTTGIAGKRDSQVGPKESARSDAYYNALSHKPGALSKPKRATTPKSSTGTRRAS